MCPRRIPSGGSFVIVLFLVVRRQERDRGQVFVLGSDASDHAESVNLAVYARAAALFDCNLNVPVILRKRRREIAVATSKKN